MVGPEEPKPEPVVSNDSITRVGNMDTQGSDHSVGTDEVGIEDRVGREVNTLMGHHDTDRPDEINKKSAKLDMQEQTSTLVGSLKLRWAIANSGVDNILDRVVGWAEINAELRINLLGWLTTRTDDQIIEDAMKMVDALENTAYNDTVTKMGEEIMSYADYY